MTQILVRGRAIICKVDKNNRPVLVEDGVVLVRGGIIAMVGPFAELSRSHADVARSRPHFFTAAGEHWRQRHYLADQASRSA
jgi:hypothetical protein